MAPFVAFAPTPGMTPRRLGLPAAVEEGAVPAFSPLLFGQRKYRPTPTAITAKIHSQPRREARGVLGGMSRGGDGTSSMTDGRCCSFMSLDPWREYPLGADAEVRAESGGCEVPPTPQSAAPLSICYPGCDQDCVLCYHGFAFVPAFAAPFHPI